MKKKKTDFFAVRAKDGKYFKHGVFNDKSIWVDNIARATIYEKLENAQARVDYFYKKYPEYGIPDIVKITNKKIEVL